VTGGRAAGRGGPDRTGLDRASLDRAGLDKAPRDVARMFDHVAARYDVTNTVLSLGQDRRWRRAVRDALDLRPGLRVLDLAAGTGTSALAFARSGARVVACDFSLGMLAAGRPRVAVSASVVHLVAGDGLQLPFADGSFDRVTISFGLRNVADVPACLRELRRVTRPGGRLVVCEFSRPTWAPFRAVYLNYLMRALPPLAKAVSSAPDAYVYLAESIRAWPSQPELGEQVAAAGWSEVSWRDLSGGIVALHRATAAGPDPAACRRDAAPACDC
jgi:demethylmenaquinone methyltransferase/2-methoxy-6-polyprenyl-1,4-benzoquinol methylase